MLKHVERDVDIAARRLGIRAEVLRLSHEVLCDRAIDAGNADIKTCVQEVVSAISQVQIEFGVYPDFAQSYFAVPRDKRDRALERSRPAGGEQLLWICTYVDPAGTSHPDVEITVGTPRNSIVAAAGRLGSGSVDEFRGFRLGSHGAPPGFALLLWLRTTSRRRDGPHFVFDGIWPTPNDREWPVKRWEIL
jgi:hypothetical protein